MSEYVEFYGDHVFLVQMIPNIAQISIFTNFIKNRIFYIYIFFIYLKKKGGNWRGTRGEWPLGTPWNPMGPLRPMDPMAIKNIKNTFFYKIDKN